MIVEDVQARQACVISDIHAGRGGSSAGMATKLVQSLGKDTLLVLNGDVGPDSHMQEMFGNTAWLWEEDDINFWWAVLEFVHQGGQVIWLPGNHDMYLDGYAGSLAEAPGFAQLLAAFPSALNVKVWQEVFVDIRVVQGLRLTVGGKVYFLHHGNRVDFVLQGGLGRWERWKARRGWMKAPSPEVYQADKAVFGKLIGYWAGQFLFYSLWGWWLGADVVIIGHWHCPGVYMQALPVPVVCGSCMTNGWQAYMLLEEDGSYRLYYAERS